VRQDYQAFLHAKAQRGSESGFAPLWLPDSLFDFQLALTEWAIRQGRCLIAADCGLGKTPMQLVWAQNVVEQTNRSVLILTPLAVSHQTIREADKFGVPAVRLGDGCPDRPMVAVTNYEKLAHFDPADYAGVVCDESSVLKAFSGVRRAQITEFLRTVPYRSLWTATAAPNDYIELGTSSEALGELGYMDMLGQFFVNDQKTSATRRYHGMMPKWRFKGHGALPFWRWVVSWARACRKPSDLGFDDGSFSLLPLCEREHVIEARTLPPGALFPLPAKDMLEEREERRRTIPERCEAAAELVARTGQPAVIWCHLNDEGDMLARLIADGQQISGQDSDERKEELYEAFSSGQLRVLITKPKIGAWGLNWQHCSHVVSFASHSYEQYYQSVRRCWRFGQEHPVIVDMIASEGEQGIKDNLARKSKQADEMFTQLIAHMGEAARSARTEYAKIEEMPSWLSPTN